MLRTLAMPLLVFALLLTGCLSEPQREVTVYTALDEEFSRPIFREFEEETGITVRAKFDTESTKTVGLVEAILAEQERPRCDVFWNNEILHTLRLQQAGLLQAYQSPLAKTYPPMYRAADGTWHGFAARARILLVNTERLEEHERPRSILALADPAWHGRGGIAKPLFGTTATHAACLFSVWGRERAEAYFRNVEEHAEVLAGNKQVALAVASGRLAFGLTDTDDAMVEIDKGMPVAIVYPDQGEDALGTLFIPNTAAIIRGSPHPAEARRLVDFLLSPPVETALARGPSTQIPLNQRVDVPTRVATPSTIGAMQVDFAAAADQWDHAAEFLRATFTGG